MTSSKKKVAWFAAGILTISLGVVGIAAAQPGGPGQESPERAKHHAEMLQKYDTNKDGKLDDTERQAMFAAKRAELAQRRADLLKKYDKNADGQLDETEREAMRAELELERFKALDTDHNGSLSLDEFKAAAQQGPGLFGRGMGGRGFGHRGGRGFHGGPGGDGGGAGPGAQRGNFGGHGRGHGGKLGGKAGKAL